MDGHLTIGELALAVQQALAESSYAGQASGRVREVPDPRTIRYYTTIGLLDKPAEMRGRTAYYGRRHLLQLVAIKRLQAEGKSLVEIQIALAAAGESTLAKWAALPESFPQTIERQARKSEPLAPTSSSVERDDFWKAMPSVKSSPLNDGQNHSSHATTAVHLKVSDKVTLVIEGSVDKAALARLQPLLKNLKDVLTQNGDAGEREPDHGQRSEPSQPDKNEREQP